MQAIEEYSKAIELDPNVTTYYCNRAMAYIKLEGERRCRFRQDHLPRGKRQPCCCCCFLSFPPAETANPTWFFELSLLGWFW
jgi:hypothetical protein